MVLAMLSVTFSERYCRDQKVLATSVFNLRFVIEQSLSV